MTGILLVTAGYDHTIRFWEAHSGLSYRSLPHPDSQVNGIAITPDKQFIAAAGNPNVRLYDVTSNANQPVIIITPPLSNMTYFIFITNLT